MLEVWPLLTPLHSLACLRMQLGTFSNIPGVFLIVCLEATMLYLKPSKVLTGIF